MQWCAGSQGVSSSAGDELPHLDRRSVQKEVAKKFLDLAEIVQDPVVE
jgi:hypothetical protein